MFQFCFYLKKKKTTKIKTKLKPIFSAAGRLFSSHVLLWRESQQRSSATEQLAANGRASSQHCFLDTGRFHAIAHTQTLESGKRMTLPADTR